MKNSRRVSLVVILCISILVLGGCNNTKKADFSGIKAVSELATLQCYYHNVAKAETEASGVFKDWLHTGYKKVWTEYDGIIELGINMDELTISQPNKSGVVEIYVPEVKVQKVDVENLQDSITDKGYFTSITKEEETTVLAEAQDQMKVSAESDEKLRNQAKEHIKDLLEGYIKNIGHTLGEEYTVKWIDKE